MNTGALKCPFNLMLHICQTAIFWFLWFIRERKTKGKERKRI